MGSNPIRATDCFAYLVATRCSSCGDQSAVSSFGVSAHSVAFAFAVSSPEPTRAARIACSANCPGYKRGHSSAEDAEPTNEEARFQGLPQ